MGVVDDLGSGNLAVGDIDLLIFRGDQHGVDQTHSGYSAAHIVDFHIVTYDEGLGDHDDDAAGQIGQGVLKGQGHSQTGYAEHGNDGGDGDVDGTEDDDRQQRPQQDAHSRADVSPHGDDRFATAQRPVHQLHEDLYHNDADDESQRTPKDGGQGQSLPGDPAGYLGQNGVKGHGYSSFGWVLKGARRDKPERAPVRRILF